MGELVKTATQFLEFVMLGGLALIVPLLFLREHIVAYWIDLIKALAGDDAQTRRWTGIAILLPLLLFIGMIVNAVSDAVLEPAHFHVIYLMARHMDPQIEKDATANAPVDPDWTFLFRPVFRAVPKEEHDARKGDAKRRGSTSAQSREAFAKSLDLVQRELRLERGAVILAGVLALFGLWFVMYGFYLLFGRSETWGISRVKRGRLQVRRGGDTLALAIVLYFVFMTCYWNAELAYHREVWCAQPQEREKPRLRFVVGLSAEVDSCCRDESRAYTQ